MPELTFSPVRDLWIWLLLSAHVHRDRAPHWSWLNPLFLRNLCKICAISVQSYLQPTPAPSTCEGHTSQVVYANLKQFAHESGVGHKPKCSFSHFCKFFLRKVSFFQCKYCDNFSKMIKCWLFLKIITKNAELVNYMCNYCNTGTIFLKICWH
jgi:hypothetical protein